MNDVTTALTSSENKPVTPQSRQSVVRYSGVTNMAGQTNQVYVNTPSTGNVSNDCVCIYVSTTSQTKHLSLHLNLRQLKS